jgi:hypothetical protein
MTMHTPTRLDCWASVATHRPWRWADTEAQKTGTGYSDNAAMCRAHRDKAERIALEGQSCEGCARIPEDQR